MSGRSDLRVPHNHKATLVKLYSSDWRHLPAARRSTTACFRRLLPGLLFALPPSLPSLPSAKDAKKSAELEGLLVRSLTQATLRPHRRAEQPSRQRLQATRKAGPGRRDTRGERRQVYGILDGEAARRDATLGSESEATFRLSMPLRW